MWKFRKIKVLALINNTLNKISFIKLNLFQNLDFQTQSKKRTHVDTEPYAPVYYILIFYKIM